MKKVLISLALLQSVCAAPAAWANSGVITFMGRIVHGTCYADAQIHAVQRMNLQRCTGAAPQVTVEVRSRNAAPQLQAGLPYDAANPALPAQPKGLYNVSYATTEAIPAHTPVRYVISYD